MLIQSMYIFFTIYQPKNSTLIQTTIECSHCETATPPSLTPPPVTTPSTPTLEDCRLLKCGPNSNKVKIVRPYNPSNDTRSEPDYCECRCRAGFIGTDPRTQGCRVPQVTTTPRPVTPTNTPGGGGGEGGQNRACLSNRQCGSGAACYRNQCINPCDNNPDLCGPNAECAVVRHAAKCLCLKGFRGDPVNGGCVNLPSKHRGACIPKLTNRMFCCMKLT